MKGAVMLVEAGWRRRVTSRRSTPKRRVTFRENFVPRIGRLLPKRTIHSLRVSLFQQQHQAGERLAPAGVDDLAAAEEGAFPGHDPVHIAAQFSV
jgi:hypothetical protein